MKPFCFSFFFENAEVHLSNKETIWFHDKTKRIDTSCDLFEFTERVSKAKIIALPHDELAIWKPKLFFVSQNVQPQVFVFGGTDLCFTEKDLEDLLECFPNSSFYVSNFIGKHPRCHILPLGNVFPDALCEPKTISVCISYCRPNSQDRLVFFDFLKETPAIQQFCIPELPLNEYNLLLARSFFSVCCCGNGYDTFRFWESLSQKAIPIVKNNVFFQALKLQYPQLPFVCIDDWKDLVTLLPELTKEFYERICQDADFSVAFEPVWVSMLSELVNIP